MIWAPQCRGAILLDHGNSLSPSPVCAEVTVNDYLASLEDGHPPAGLSAPLQSLWQEARGDWEAAHRTVQAQDTRDAAWVHAYLHRKEGDAANAGYWYRRAKRPASDAALEVEWRDIVSTLLDAVQAA